MKVDRNILCLIQIKFRQRSSSNGLFLANHGAGKVRSNISQNCHGVADTLRAGDNLAQN